MKIHTADLQELIVKRTMGALSSENWPLDAYLYLVAHGASSNDAIEALELFLDEVIALKLERACIEHD